MNIDLLERLAFETKGYSPYCRIRSEDLPLLDFLGRPAQLYCPTCGNELRGGHIVQYLKGGEADAWLYCLECGWFIEGKDAVMQIRAAWLECDGFGLTDEAAKEYARQILKKLRNEL